VEGGDLRLNVTAGGTPENPLYLGTNRLGLHSTCPSARCANAGEPLGEILRRRRCFTVEQAIVDVGRSHLDLQAKTKNFESPDWTYRYRAWLDLLDIRELFALRKVPLGRIDLRGEGTLASGIVKGKGEFAADNIVLSFVDFHSANLTSRSATSSNPMASFCRTSRLTHSGAASKAESL